MRGPLPDWHTGNRQREMSYPMQGSPEGPGQEGLLGHLSSRLVLPSSH